MDARGPVGRISLLGVPSGLWVGLWMESVGVSRICILLMPSQFYIQLSQSLPAPQSYSSWCCTLGGAWEKWTPSAASCTVGEDMCSLTHFFPCRINHSWEDLSWPYAVPPWGGIMWVKSSCSFYLLQCIQIYVSFAPVVCWNFSSGNLYCYKGSLIHGWLSKTVFSRGSQSVAEGG